jgi:predicted ribosome quality control (RQC) complex YloA/Tae2 family protein
MKNIILIILLAIAHIGIGQVFSGGQEIDKSNREGGYILSETNQKIVEKSWQGHLTTIGKQQVSKNGITIKDAKIEGISTDPITVYSRVWTQRDRTHIFLSAVLANGEIVTNGHPKWSELEKFLMNYQNKLGLEDGVRKAETDQNLAQENHKKVVKAGDKLKDKIEENKKDKEKLLKKIEENRIELEKLLTDVETNKKDQTKALDEIEVKKKSVDEAKTKVPK